MNGPVRERRCVDCAFHPKSPENEFGSGGCASEGASIVQVLEMRLRDRERKVEPFYCHENLPCVPGPDGWRSVARGWEEVAGGTVLEVCAGWAAAYRRIVGEEPAS